MNVLVTGAAGLTGAEVVRSLLARGHAVRGLVRRDTGRASVPAGAEPVVGDCRDRARMSELLRSADALVHVAGILLGRELASVEGITSPGTVVVVSTAGIYSRHRASAGLYRLNEDALRDVRPDVVLVRPTMIYGSPRDRNVHYVIDLARRYGVLPLVGGSGQLMQPIHYRDLASVIAALVGTRPDGPVDAGGGDAITVRRAGELIFAALGRPARFIPVPAMLALLAARIIDRPRGSHWAERIERLMEDRSVDNARLIGVTGIAPRTFEDGVRQQVAGPDRGPA